jgi:hypothetical protein
VAVYRICFGQKSCEAREMSTVSIPWRTIIGQSRNFLYPPELVLRRIERNPISIETFSMVSPKTKATIDRKVPPDRQSDRDHQNCVSPLELFKTKCNAALRASSPSIRANDQTILSDVRGLHSRTETIRKSQRSSASERAADIERALRQRCVFRQMCR